MRSSNLISEVTVAESAEQQPVSITSIDPSEQPSVSSSSDSQEPGPQKRKATKLGAFFKLNETQEDDTVAPLSPEQKLLKRLKFM